MPPSPSHLDLDALSKAELEALRHQVAEALAKADIRRRRKALAAARRAVEEFGLTLEEVLAFASETQRPRAVRFRNPENPQQTWSGRGRRPTWFVRQLAAGKSPDDLQA
jgi:DNA-binding protein H-NS